MKKKYLECQNCHEKKKDVKVIWDPYSYDVNDEVLEIQVCNNCAYERALGI